MNFLAKLKQKIIIKDYYKNFKSIKFYLIYILLSFLMCLLTLILNIYFVQNNINGYFEANKGFIEQLAQFNDNSHIYEKLLELSSSIYNYENRKGNFFSAEIWSCDICLNNDFPTWSVNDTLLTEVRIEILKNITLNKNFLIFNKYLFSANIIPIHAILVKNEKITHPRIYKILYYKKVLDFNIFGYNPNFYFSIIVCFILFFILFLILISIPIHIIKSNLERDIEKRAIISIKNLIEHTLINQESILSVKTNKIDEKISRALYHNHEAQILLKKISHEDINIKTLLEKMMQEVYCPEEISINCEINIKNKIHFSKNLLLFSFSTIIHNAIHPSVKAKNIFIKILQKTFKNEVIIEVSNDGLEIPKGNRKKILKGFTSKQDGHGKGLKNLGDLLSDSGSSLKLLNKTQTTFSFNVKTSDIFLPIKENFTLKKVDIISNPIYKNSSLVINEDLPLVVIIEDEELIWDSWKVNMSDANILFFRDPNDFIFHCDLQILDQIEFISQINMIICDYDFGDNTNLSNSGIFNSLAKYEEKFNGFFVLCTGFNESIIKEIPENVIKKIDLFYQKKATNYKVIYDKIRNKNLDIVQKI